MTLQEFVAARVGTRFYAVTASGRLTVAARRCGASRAISEKMHDKLAAAWARGEGPGDKLSNVDLRLLRGIEDSLSARIICTDSGTYWHPRVGKIGQKRLKKWRRIGIIEPLPGEIFPDISLSFTMTAKGLHIGKGVRRHF